MQVIVYAQYSILKTPMLAGGLTFDLSLHLHTYFVFATLRFATSYNISVKVLWVGSVHFQKFLA